MRENAIFDQGGWLSPGLTWLRFANTGASPIMIEGCSCGHSATLHGTPNEDSPCPCGCWPLAHASAVDPRI